MAAICWGLAALHAVLSRRRVAWARLSGAAVLAVALAAGQWMPTAAALEGSRRLALPAEERAYWSVHPASLIQIVLPVPLGDLPLEPGARAALFESREPLLRSLYLGLPALALAGAGLVARAVPRIAVASGIIGLLMSLGAHTPLFGLAASAFPLLYLFRYPAKFLLMASFAVALLIGFGCDSWRGMRPRRRLWTAACVALLAAPACWSSALAGEDVGRILAAAREHLALATAATLGVLVLSRFPARGAPLAGVLVAAELSLQHLRANPTAPPGLFRDTPPAVAAIRGDGGRRVHVLDYARVPGAALALLGREAPFRMQASPDRDWRWLEALALRAYLLPPVGSVWDLAGSFDADLLGLQPVELAAFRDRVGAAIGTRLYVRLLRLGGVSHAVSLHASGYEDFALVAALPSPFGDPIRVWRVPDPLPTAYAVGESRIADGAAALDLIEDATFDPRRTVVLARGPVLSAGPGFRGEGRVTESRPDRVRVAADLSADGFVVVLEGYDRGWTASVDGRAAEVLRANVAFRAVPVPSGRHVVELEYRPRALSLGLAASAAALVACVALLAHRPRQEGP
jgi:hypothetical protein